MKTIILSLAIAIMLPVLAGAQKREVPRMNFEFGGGANFWACKDGGLKVEAGPSFFIEGRYNMDEFPVNVGLHIDISAFRRKREYNDYEKPRSLKFVIVGDYSPRRGKYVSPFAGIGIGVASDEHDFEMHTPPRTGICLMPRVGVRLLKHVAFTLDYEISHISHNHFDFKMGFYF
ncbi:MAG: porin family protein [Odoribacteraceae bacterium]|jgi:opacity protein-like surface antigen|nr:porin family protein [Odoribacteraceae bacterium]